MRPVCAAELHQAAFRQRYAATQHHRLARHLESSRLHISQLRPAAPHPAIPKREPNPSVKPTHSGLRPPWAAYLKRWAARNTVRAMLRSSQFPPVCIAVAERTSLCALARPMRIAKGASQPSKWAVRPSAASAPGAVRHRHRLWRLIRMRVVAPLLSVSYSGVYSLHSLARQP